MPVRPLKDSNGGSIGVRLCFLCFIYLFLIGLDTQVLLQRLSECSLATFLLSALNNSKISPTWLRPRPQMLVSSALLRAPDRVIQTRSNG
jgi:hypothetical protein